MKWQVTLTLSLLYFWERTPEHPYTKSQIGYRANPDVTPKAEIHAPSTKWTLICPVPTHFAYSTILTDMIYLYHTNAYLKFISFPRMYGRLPVKSHTSTIKVTWSPMCTEVSSVGLGIATWKYLWTRQLMWFTPFLFTMPKTQIKIFSINPLKDTCSFMCHKLALQL